MSSENWSRVRRQWKSMKADKSPRGSHPIYCQTWWAGVEFVAAFNQYDAEGRVSLVANGGSGCSCAGGVATSTYLYATGSFASGLDLTYGRFERSSVEGFVSGPLTDTLKARFAARWDYGNEGWQESYHSPGPGHRLGKVNDFVGRLLLGEELNVIDKTAWKPLWVTEFPLLDYSPEEKRKRARCAGYAGSR